MLNPVDIQLFRQIYLQTGIPVDSGGGIELAQKMEIEAEKMRLFAEQRDQFMLWQVFDETLRMG